MVQHRRNAKEFHQPTTDLSSEKKKKIFFYFLYDHLIVLIFFKNHSNCSEEDFSFHREEIQRIKAGNPDISHREAFSAAAKNVNNLILSVNYFFTNIHIHNFVIPLQWAHFPHIHFGLMPDQGLKKSSVRPQVICLGNRTKT